MDSKQKILKKLPSPSLDKLDRLIENRTVYSANDFELNVFDTFEKVENFKLSFGNLALVSMINGEKKMQLNTEDPFRFVPGQSAWLSENTQMNIDFPKAALDNPAQCTVLLLQDSKINKVLNYLNEYSPKTLSSGDWTISNTEKLFENTPELAALLNRFFRLCMSSDSYKDALAHLQLQEILIRIMHKQQLLAIEKNTAANSNPIQYLKNYIENHLTEKISIKDLGDKVHMSTSSLYRRFKSELGISPQEFIQEMRINKAKTLLKNGMNVKEVAAEVGVFDDNYFIRIFKKHTGQTPGSFG